MRKLFVVLGALAIVATAYLGMTWPYWRNWWVWDMSDPNRVIDSGKYVPQYAIETGTPTPLEMVSPFERTLSEETVQELQTLARKTQSFAFLVSHGDRLQFSYYAEAIGPETPLDSYSIHKGLLALAFGYAVDTGYLESIDTFASEYIPEWQDDARREITIRQLLNNESGLKRLEYSTVPHNPVLDFFIGRDLERLTFSFPLDFAPGTAFEFNHVNSQVLHFVLVRATGKSYADILSEYLWKPLGNDVASVALDHQGGAARTICCFLSSAPNWIRIGMLLNNLGRFRNRQIVSEAWIQEMLKPAPRNPNFGFNIWIGEPFTGRRLHSAVKEVYREITGPFDVSDVYFMEASGNGRLYFVPSKDVVIVRFGKRIPDQKWDDGGTVNMVLSGIR
jgi:CubicO group peptidase (beta-lactamase class C family)